MKCQNSAVSTIIGAILILGLIVSVAALIKVAYIPDMKKEAEASHMENALKDFINIRSYLDTVQAASVTGRSLSVTSSMKMGGGDIPFIDPAKSSGTMALDPGYGSFNVKACYYNGSYVATFPGSSMGKLVYSSNNAYWIDQKFTYESGMVVLSQLNGNLTKSTPNIYAMRDPTNSSRIIMTVAPIRLSGAESSISSTDIQSVRFFTLPENTIFAGTNVTNITINITTQYPGQWSRYFEEMLSSSGLTEGVEYYLQSDGNSIRLDITGNGPDNIRLYYLDTMFLTSFNSQVVMPSITPTATPYPEEPVTLNVTLSSYSIGRNDKFNITVQARYANGTTASGYRGTVYINTDPFLSKPEGFEPFDPHTYTPGDSGVFVFTNVKIKQEGTYTIVASDGTATGSSQAIIVSK
jgi:hypothetical protein